MARLAARDHGDAVGSRAVLYLVVSPFAVFLFAGYSETLFLALAVGSWLAARQRRWLLAGTLAGLAGTVRITGAFLGVALVVQWFTDAEGRRWRTLPALLLPWAGIAAFSVYLHAITGDWLAWQHVEADAFGRHLELPWTSFLTTWHAAGDPAQPSAFAWSFGVEIVALAVGAALTVVLLVRRDWGEAVYVGGQVAALATSSFYASVARGHAGVVAAVDPPGGGRGAVPLGARRVSHARRPAGGGRGGRLHPRAVGGLTDSGGSRRSRCQPRRRLGHPAAVNRRRGRAPAVVALAAVALAACSTTSTGHPVAATSSVTPLGLRVGVPVVRALARPARRRRTPRTRSPSSRRVTC